MVFVCRPLRRVARFPHSDRSTCQIFYSQARVTTRGLWTIFPHDVLSVQTSRKVVDPAPYCVNNAAAAEVAISTINAARHQRLTEEFVPFLAIYYYLSQFIDCPSSDSSIAATVIQRHD